MKNRGRKKNIYVHVFPTLSSNMRKASRKRRKSRGKRISRRYTVRLVDVTTTEKTVPCPRAVPLTTITVPDVSIKLPEPSRRSGRVLRGAREPWTPQTDVSVYDRRLDRLCHTCSAPIDINPSSTRSDTWSSRHCFRPVSSPTLCKGPPSFEFAHWVTHRTDCLALDLSVFFTPT